MQMEKIESVKLKIGGMTCINCQTKIEKALLKTEGILSAKVDWKKESAQIRFDSERVSTDKIIKEIENCGYTVKSNNEKKEEAKNTLFYLALITVLFLLLQRTGLLNALSPSSLATSSMSYALLFVTGLFTSLHCVAMCGGINISQSLPKKHKNMLSPLLYNLGRLCSYTLIGLVLGALGFVFGSSAKGLSIPLSFQGLLKVIAGLAMLFMGISLLGILPSLRYITPHLPSFLSKKISAAKSKTPFFVGFLNGFMPCGSLQAMWIVALASANPISGALSMFFFSLGTIPLMLFLGSIFSVLGKKYMNAVMKTGAVIVVVISLSMMSQGFALGAFSSKGENKEVVAEKQGANIVIEDGKQIVKSTLNPYRYPTITVKKDLPVHWEIEASEKALTGCNYRMIFRDFGFMYEMGYGKNVIEFTAEKTGSFQYTCWMGMVRGVIKVVD